MDEVLFNAAVARALLRRHEGGIGVLGEKTLHSALKYYYEPNELSHEREREGYFADVMNERGIIEVQTGSMGRLRPKLAEYLKTTPVTVVHPVIRKKTIIWVDPATGEAVRSTAVRRGKTADAFLQLMYLGDLPVNERLTVLIPLLDAEETRLLDGRGRDRKKACTKLDRVPTALISETRLACAEDYLSFVPEELLCDPEGFTVARLKKAGYNDAVARAMLYTLMNTGLIERRKQGRGYVYLRPEKDR